jgi:hypothetical protein
MTSDLDNLNASYACLYSVEFPHLNVFRTDGQAPRHGLSARWSVAMSVSNYSFRPICASKSTYHMFDCY